MKKNMKKITALHKYIGIAVCIILIHLAVTGIFLNHTQDLDLDLVMDFRSVWPKSSTTRSCLRHSKR